MRPIIGKLDKSDFQRYNYELTGDPLSKSYNLDYRV